MQSKITLPLDALTLAVLTMPFLILDGGLLPRAALQHPLPSVQEAKLKASPSQALSDPTRRPPFCYPSSAAVLTDALCAYSVVL